MTLILPPKTNDNSPKIRIPDQALLDSWNMKRDDFQNLVDFIGRESLSLPEGNTIIKRKSVNPQLPYSLAYNSNCRSFVILFKNHGVEVIGEGTSNRVTLGYDMQNECEVAFRSGPEERLSSRELEMNQKLAAHPNLFITAKDYFCYEGPCSERVIWEPSDGIKPKPKQSVVQSAQLPQGPKTQIKKIGTILELGKCTLKGFLSKYQSTDCHVKMYIALCIAEGLKVLHRNFQMVYLDMKYTNIIITKDGYVKITDFGTVSSQGRERKSSNIRWFTPPDIIKKIILKEKYVVDSSFDMWGFGIILLQLVNPSEYQKWRQIVHTLRNKQEHWQVPDEAVSIIYPPGALESFEKETEKFLDNLGNNLSGWEFLVLKQYLTMDIGMRANAYEAVRDLKEILALQGAGDIESLRKKLALVLSDK